MDKRSIKFLSNSQEKNEMRKFMKNIKPLVSMAIALITLSAPVLSFAQTNLAVPSKPLAVFTPKGFTNNNNAQVVIAGSFGNYCYKLMPPQFKVDTEHYKIYIDNSVYTPPHCTPAEMFIPYSTVISLGYLPIGKYEVLTLDSFGKYGKQADLPIALAQLLSPGRDDSLYVPVSDASFEVKRGQSFPTLTLRGIFPNTCIALKSVQVKMRAGGVLEVLPYAGVKTNPCVNKPTAFATTIRLENFPKTTTLIHIRSMNGQAINKVITSLDWISQR